MRPTTGLCFILAIGFAASAESIDLSGTVSAQNGDPISGASVTLVGQNLAGTTDADGAYSITGAVGTVRVDPGRGVTRAEEFSLRNGIVRLRLTKPARVEIDIFDMTGKLLKRVLKGRASAGDYRFDITADPLAAQVVAVRVAVDLRVSSFRYAAMADRAVSSAIAVSSAGGGLAKQSGVDILKVSAPGYVTKEVSISSYQGVVDIVLDTVDLPLFSFFVTSLKALQELSGSEIGFGGDLRFGHTGPGAGLRGADSICECIAEKSMPGSKVKIWRALLSVAADENGEQVNAIDRIGQGPWYDRLGRLLAPTLADLLHERPQNGDPVIQNDLPNENGIPNHYPDPNGPAEDNHHMITGSDTNGRLFSQNGTCDDWISVTAGGRPRCGFAWPRGGSRGGSMGGHWISGIDAASCKSGVQVTTQNTGDHIGSAGGYGGFYCFALNP